MSTSTYTPGPWIARPYPESKNHRITITGATSPIPIAEIVPTTMKGYDPLAEANGRLIAAAPRLLAAYQDMAELVEAYLVHNDVSDDAFRKELNVHVAMVSQIERPA
jgi:hypothetical protein